jgi:hypothetical protein
MGFAKKFGAKVRSLSKFGHKAAKSVGFGVKKAAHFGGKVARKVEQLAKIAGKVAVVTGQPELAGLAGAVGAAAKTAEGVAGIAERGGGGLEKIGKKQYRDGFGDVASSVKGAQEMFR